MKSLVALLLVGVIALSFLSAKTQWDDTGGSDGLIPQSKAKTAPNFTIPDVGTGQLVDLQATARRQPVVFSFWATWCGPCRMELPHLQALSEKYRGRVQFYGINGDASPETIKKFAAQNNLTFPMLSDNQGVAHTRYSVDSIPLMVVVDHAGKVRAVTEGYDPEMDDHLPKVLDALIAGQ